jgi:gliding motility-associated protein GldC
MKNTEINFKIQLDENHLPEKINWDASESDEKGFKPCKSAFISMWDPKENQTLKIDLWTKDMLVEDMKRFYHQTLVSMANTFGKATGEEKMAGDMRDFCEYFAEKMGLVSPK